MSPRGLGRAADLGCLLADGDPAGSGEGSPVGPGGGHAAVWPGTAGRGERTLAVQWYWLSQGLSWRQCVTGTSWFGLPPVLHFTSHHSGDLPLLAVGNMWLPITPALCSSLGSEPQHVFTQDKLSFCPCRCCLLGTFSQVSVYSLPSGVFSQLTPSMHRTLPATPNWVLCAHGRGAGISHIHVTSTEVPALPTHSWKSDKPKHPLHPSPVLTSLTNRAALCWAESRAGCRRAGG